MTEGWRYFLTHKLGGICGGLTGQYSNAFLTPWITTSLDIVVVYES